MALNSVFLNCKWATYGEQAINRRKSRKLKSLKLNLDGVRRVIEMTKKKITVAEIADCLGVGRDTVYAARSGSAYAPMRDIICQ